jgi:hypothetical protein
MSVTSDDEIVLTDDGTSRQARLYQWFLDHLAKFPGRVTVVTFAAAAAVTAVVVTVDGDASPTTVISLGATLWALFFAVMIYLLTARDTDKVLDQIADLREQLSTALAAPDEEEALAKDELAHLDAPQPETPTGPPDAPVAGASQEAGRADRIPPDERSWVEGRRESGPLPVDGSQDRTRPDARAYAAPRLLVGVPAIVDGVPSDLLDAWASSTGKSRDDLSRAWTRDPRRERQWVLETVGSERWVVFSKGARGVGVMSLDAGGRGRARRPPRS